MHAQESLLLYAMMGAWPFKCIVTETLGLLPLAKKSCYHRELIISFKFGHKYVTEARTLDNKQVNSDQFTNIGTTSNVTCLQL
jgi:hypothetical protein